MSFKTLSVLAISAFSMSANVFAGYVNEGVPTEVASRFLFVPGGFDNNDQVQVTLDGYLPNSCYKIAEPRVDFDEGSKTFTVTAMANNFESDTVVCGTYEVPYTVTANLAQVKEGQYKVVTNLNPKFKFSESTGSPRSTSIWTRF